MKGLSEELNTSAEFAARRLLGARLIREIDGHTLVGRIVETEAYDQSDVASHSYRGQTERTKVMFGSAGFLYVYFTYGMHYCCNIVVGEPGYGAAVLLRALEPVSGLEFMRERRHNRPDLELTNGSAKLCQALGINKVNNGHDLSQGDIQLELEPPVSDVVQTTRIGISHGQEVPWRFYLKDNPYVSKTV